MIIMWPTKKEDKETTEKIEKGAELVSKGYDMYKKSLYISEHWPETWYKYPKDLIGAKSILDMEVKELMNAETKSEVKQELTHVAAAAMNLWRMMDE